MHGETLKFVNILLSEIRYSWISTAK